MTGFLYHPDFLKHDTGQGHPERPARLEAITRRLNETGLLQKMQAAEPKPASLDTIAQVHPKSYIEKIRDSWPTHPLLDSDTTVSQHSFASALLAAGAAVQAVDKVSAGTWHNAFCAVRPPGHHAEYDQAMGFCLFNNVAIAAQWLRRNQRSERVLIIDWDVHHGNGTQNLFYDRGDVFYLSLHQWPLYPGTGRVSETGVGTGAGATRNVPVPPGTSEDVYLAAFESAVAEVYAAFKPDFTLISAGFDAHRDDPLAQLNLTEAAYGHMTAVLIELARKYGSGRIVSLLEGGYNLEALAGSVAAHVERLIQASVLK